MSDELLQLMLKFKLCYQLTDRPDIFLAPELLNPEQPAYDWNSDENLIVRYTYEFMPKGILTTLIVEMHQWLKSQDLVWRSGMILQEKNTEAEVIETYSKREIRIQIRGKQKRDLLIKITHELDKIHRTFSGLKFQKLVPCNCIANCKNSPNPHFYDDQILRKFMTDGQPEIQCPQSYKMVNVRGLLDDILETRDLTEKRYHETTEASRIEKQYNFYSEVKDPNFFGGSKVTGEQPRVSINANNIGVAVNEGTISGHVRIVGQYNENGADLQIILKIIESMRENISAFPAETQDNLVDDIDDVETELNKPADQRDQNKLVRKLKRIATTAVTGFALVAAPTAGMIDFANNITDLAAKVEPAQVQAIQDIVYKALPFTN